LAERLFLLAACVDRGLRGIIFQVIRLFQFCLLIRRPQEAKNPLDQKQDGQAASRVGLQGLKAFMATGARTEAASRRPPGRRRVCVLNGPNLNLLGVREPQIYGTATLADIRHQCEAKASQAGLDLAFHQSNHEGELVDLIHAARDNADAIVFNPAGYSFTSVAILDALRIFERPIVEVHISNIHRRDKLHRHSIISTVATAVICGLGPQGYVAALDAIAAMPASSFSASTPPAGK
jgi:3-dehydroquinate dehydratase-2